MISLSASGGSITFTFSGNSGYLQDGVITVPVNSLTLVTDNSEMATFRKSASNDIFISALYSDFGMTKEQLVSFYKNNMVGSTGGGGGTVDQTIISGSTNAVAGGAVYDAVMVSSASTVETTGYTRYWPSENEHATYATGTDNLTVYNYWRDSSHLYRAEIEIVDSQGNTVSGSVRVEESLNTTNVVPSTLSSYLTATVSDIRPYTISYQTVDGYKISWANIFDDNDDGWYIGLSLKTVENINEIITASDAINYILGQLNQ